MGRIKRYDGSSWVDVAPSAQEFDAHSDEYAQLDQDFEHHKNKIASDTEYGHVRLSDIPHSKGVRVLSSDPTNPQDGEMWLNSTTETLKLALDDAQIPIQFSKEEIIYHDGTEYVPMVLGYTRGDYDFRKLSSNIRLNTEQGSSSATNHVALVTDTPVNLARVNSIEFDISISSNSGNVYFVVSTEKMDSHGTYDARISVRDSGREVYEIDTEGLTGDYYIRAHLLSSTSSRSQLSVHSISINY